MAVSFLSNNFSAFERKFICKMSWIFQHTHHIYVEREREERDMDEWIKLMWALFLYMELA